MPAATCLPIAAQRAALTTGAGTRTRRAVSSGRNAADSRIMPQYKRAYRLVARFTRITPGLMLKLRA